ncbi:gastrula zinc finger protein XlCGF17.1-like [Wyeomyia smithii]|uniref:gastrula zinc finger protein XlCGF17.1-like n=1 Tax=Wyeomyia smithii TaxID=174621 RepID=UPI002467B003|nr:gastrula zinc finger protein XlCGF17.1-like [Wyeomyia smithii]
MANNIQNEAVCRVCLSTNDSKFRLLYKESLICGKKRNFADLLMECIPTLQEYLIENRDNLPKTICSKCCLTLKHFVRFRRKCLEANHRLQTDFKTSLEIISKLKKDIPLNDSLIEMQTETDNSAIKQHEQISTNEIIEAPKSSSAEPTESLNTNFQCQYCHKILSTNKSYRCHLQLHSQESSFLCNCCGERFKTKMAYTGHMNTHNPEKYRCDTCGKSYRQAASLRNHQLNHSQEKPFNCSICGHSTTQKSGLKKHMLIHSDTKSFVCDLCGEHFRFSSNLIMHKRRKHSREKNYTCAICPKGFVSKEELTNHSMCHTDERPFACDLCGKNFNRKSSLKFHRKHKHLIMATIACHVCGRGFSQKVSLQNHLRTHILTD